VSKIEGSGKRSLRRPRLSTRKFSAWRRRRRMMMMMMMVMMWWRKLIEGY